MRPVKIRHNRIGAEHGHAKAAQLFCQSGFPTAWIAGDYHALRPATGCQGRRRQIRRRRTGETHFLARAGMPESQTPGMQHLTRGLGLYCFGRIELVAQQRIAQVSEMHADLVCPSGVNAHRQQRDIVLRRSPEPCPLAVRGLAAARLGTTAILILAAG